MTPTERRPVDIFALAAIDSPAPTTDEAAPYLSHLEHLSDAIARIADLGAAHLARAPQEGGRRYRGVDREELLERALLRSRQGVPTETRELWELADRKLARMRAREQATEATGLDLPLVRLARTFGLSQQELDVLVLAAAPHVDTAYAQELGATGPELLRPEIGSVIAVLSRSFEQSVRLRRIFSLDAPLLASSLVLAEGSRTRSEGDFLGIVLEAPRRIVAELLGNAAIEEELVAFSRVRVPTVGLHQIVLPPETKSLVQTLVDKHDTFIERRREWGIDDVVSYGRGTILLFEGPPGTGKTMLANAMAHAMGKRLFTVDVSKLAELSRTIEANLDSVFREAKLLDALLFFDECEQIFASRRAGNGAMSMLLTRIEQFDGMAILATNMAEVLDEALHRRIVATIHFSSPSPAARVEIWRRHLPPALPLEPDVDVEKLASDFELTGGLIKNAVLDGVLWAVGRGAKAISLADLEHGARLQVRREWDGPLELVNPDARLDDVVLPDELRNRIDRFVAAARVRSTVLSDWGLGQTLGHGLGLTALLSGPPGTGKTLTAEAIAAALERPVVRCSIPGVISRYVGDTAKNLDRLFATAREHRAVLLFDEADALFAKRVAVHSANDRFANAETGALLRQLEIHEGVVILTSNLVEEIDRAFERRIHLQARFPRPDATARAAIWRRLLTAEVPLAADVDFPRLGRAFDLSGGLIRNAVLGAALEAAAMAVEERLITQAMLERAAREQLGATPEPEAAVTGLVVGAA
jgi:SpoVK/Ycf46/Vps4 family AAA+-type ATPase